MAYLNVLAATIKRASIEGSSLDMAAVIDLPILSLLLRLVFLSSDCN